MHTPELLRAFAEPLAIEDRCLAVIEAYALRVLAGKNGDCASTLETLGIRPATVVVPQGAAVRGGSVEEQSDFEIVGDVGVMHVWGLLDRKDPVSKGKRIGTGYERIARTARAMRSDDRIGSLVAVVDSPGGAVRGNSEAAEAFFDAAEAGRGGGKPLTVYAPAIMASAALLLGSQANRVYVGPEAWVGSIGARLSTLDVSEQLSREGVKVNTIKSVEFKDLGSPYRAMTDRDRAVLQAEIDTYHRMFKGWLVRGLRTSAERIDAVATGEGFIGQRAVDVGLAHAVKRDLPSVIAEMSKEFPARGKRAAVAVSPARSANMTPEEIAAKEAADAKAAKEAEDAKKAKAAAEQAPGGRKEPGTEAPALAPDAVAKAVQAVHERTAKIESICAPYAHIDAVAQLRRKATTEDTGMSVEALSARVLELVTAQAEPIGSLDISVGSTGWERERQGIEACVIAKLDPMLISRLEQGGDAAARAAKALGFVDAATGLKTFRTAESNGLRRMRLFDMAERCAKMAAPSRFQRGAYGGDYDNQVLASAFGLASSDFPILLANAGNKALQAYFAEITPQFMKFCAVGRSEDFKSTDLITLSELPNLLLTPEGAPLKEASFNERKEAIKVLTYGRKFSITRETIINDDLGAIQRILQTWGIVAARVPDILAFGVLTANPVMADGDALFHANHKNLGGAAALSVASMSLAVRDMKRQRSFGEDKVYLQVEPKTLLTGTHLWDQAVRVCTSVIDPTVANANSNVPNVIQRLGIEPVNSPYLDTSDTQWFLAGDPRIAPGIQVNFLKGNRNPIVVAVGNGSIRGQEMEVIFDAGVKAVQFEGLYKNAGA